MIYQRVKITVQYYINLKKLNESEKKQILELKQQRLSVAKISKVIIKSRRVIQNLLKNVEDYGKKKSTGRPSSLPDRDKRVIAGVYNHNIRILS